jgi:hypothetical protein
MFYNGSTNIHHQIRNNTSIFSSENEEKTLLWRNIVKRQVYLWTIVAFRTGGGKVR